MKKGTITLLLATLVVGLLLVLLAQNQDMILQPLGNSLKKLKKSVISIDNDSEKIYTKKVVSRSLLQTCCEVS